MDKSDVFTEGTELMEIPEPSVSRRGPGPSSPCPPAGPSDAGPYHIDTMDTDMSIINIVNL